MNVLQTIKPVRANGNVRLPVWFNDGTNGSQFLTPDQRLAPNGYLPDDSVTSAKIASSAIGNFPALSGSNLTGLIAGTARRGIRLRVTRLVP